MAWYNWEGENPNVTFPLFPRGDLCGGWSHLLGSSISCDAADLTKRKCLFAESQFGSINIQQEKIVHIHMVFLNLQGQF